MKKVGKILALVISLVLIVSAIVLVASAEEEITVEIVEIPASEPQTDAQPQSRSRVNRSVRTLSVQPS